MIINSNQSLESAIAQIRESYGKHKYLRLDIKTGKQRTNPQNAALHVYCKLVAHALNDAGIDFRKFIKEGYEIPFNEYLVKEYLWRVIQNAMTGKDSTTKPKTSDYPKIYEVLNRKLAEHGIHVPWPTKEDQ
jgi:hypothetical protein